MTPSPKHIDELTQRLARGDRDAFRPLYDALWPVLLAYCMKALGEEPAAQDAAQEALLKVYSRVGQYDPRKGRALTWAMQIAAYECLTVRKRRVRRREEPAVDAPERCSANATPEDVVITRELVAAARELLAELPTAQREAIVTRLFDQPRAGASAATWRKRWERGVRALRRAWRSRHAQ